MLPTIASVLAAAAQILDLLGDVCSNEYSMQANDLAYLDKAIATRRTALRIRQSNQPPQSSALNDLAVYLSERYNKLSAISDLQEAIALHRNILELCPESNPLRSLSLNNLAMCLFSRYTNLAEMKDLEEAIERSSSALALRPEGHPLRYTSLNNLATYHRSRYTKLGAVDDLSRAITLQQAALELRPVGHSDRPISLNNLGALLFDRYGRLGQIDDLNDVILMHRGALEYRPEGHPHRSVSLYNLGLALSTRHDRLGDMKDLEEAILLHRGALELRPQGHPDRAMSLNSLAICLSTQYRQRGDMRDLEEAIAIYTATLELLPPVHPLRPEMMNNLATCFSTRYDKLGQGVGKDGKNDLDTAIELHRAVAQLIPQNHPHRLAPLNNLAGCLSLRYQTLGNMDDLMEAITTHRFALALRPQGHPDRALSLSGLGICLGDKHKQQGDLRDFKEAVTMHRAALELRPPGHPLRASSMNNLATLLTTRHVQQFVMSDLEEAIALHRDALELRPNHHPYRHMTLNNLAQCLTGRYEVSREICDLQEAIMMQREVVELCSPGHHFRSTALNNLGCSLLVRYSQLREPDDLEEMIKRHEEALELRLPGHPDRSASMVNLADSLSKRYVELGGTEDLEEAIALYRNALHDLSPGHPFRSLPLQKLADLLCTRFERFDAIGDKEEMFQLYSQLSKVSPNPPVKDLAAAKNWVHAAEVFGHHSTLTAYQTSLETLVRHIATLPSLPQYLSRLKYLVSSLAVDAFSAYIRRGSLTGAIEVLEQGRGVFWTQLLRLRSPLDDVIASGDTGKTLAEKFTMLCSLLNRIPDSPFSSQHDRAWHLSIQLQEVVTDIRKLPGLSRFLLPSLFSDLQKAAIVGPVIIVNASQYSCDALIILPDQDPVHVPLAITKATIRELALYLSALTGRAKTNDVTKDLGTLLRELWNLVVSPIVDILLNFRPRRSRIWWCPTAEFSLLPLHAAGAYKTGQPNLSDLYISSYTPTLTALIHARQQSASMSTPERQHVVAIGQANAKGERELASVHAELANVAERITPFATVTCLEGGDAGISRVTEALRKNAYVHLACHGVSDSKRPFESAFPLHDRRLKIEDIMRLDMENPQFAYLSACQTTVGDEESPDEVIHLAAAMHYAGFRSVIGTMWAVDDAHTNKITSAFYGNMVDESGRLDHTRAAYALHKTMRTVAIPFDQRLLFIHIGA